LYKLDVLCSLLAFRPKLNLERNALTDLRASASGGKCLDVDKDLLIAPVRLDKPKASFVVPDLQDAFKSCWHVLSRWRRPLQDGSALEPPPSSLRPQAEHRAAISSTGVGGPLIATVLRRPIEQVDRDQDGRGRDAARIRWCRLAQTRLGRSRGLASAQSSWSTATDPHAGG
jgi:hypothetical protein